MLRLTDASSGALQRSIALESGMPVAAAISDRIAVITFANGESGVYDLERGEKVATLRTLGDAATKIAALAILHDSEPFLAAVLTASNGLALADAGRAPLALQSGEGHGGDIRALAALPQRGLIATAGADRTVRAWSAETLAAVRVYRGHTSALTALAVPDDNRAIAAGSADGHIRIWSAASTRLIRSFRAHDAGVAAIAYAASGDILASAGTDGVIKVWDRRRTRPVATLDRERGSAVRALAFTADSRRLIIAGEDGSLRAWDLGAVKIARE